MFPEANKEQLEVFINSVFSTTQSLVYQIGSSNIDDQFIENFVRLTTELFNSMGVVCSGGIFAIHGLLATIGTRILKFAQYLLPFITCAITDVTRTDESGMKNAAGLIIDLASELQHEIKPFAFGLLEALLSNLNNSEVNIESKLVCIVAIGDLIMAAGISSDKLHQVATAFEQAASLSLSTGQSTEEEEIHQKLREALIEAYISVVHS